MATVTGIVPSTKKQGRFVVEVDGRPAATLSLETIERLRVATGVPYDAPLAAAVEREAAALHAFDRACNILAMRARSTRDLRKRLIDKGEPAEAADRAIEKLTELGLVNDAEYAKQLTRSKVLGPGLSRRRLRTELSRKGVAREVADSAIEEVLEDDSIDEEQIIERVARKKLKTLDKLDPQSRRRRLYAFLMRRGYESDDIGRLLGTLLKDGDEVVDDE